MLARQNTLKLVLAGDGGVGKTTLIYKLIGKQEISQMTRGVDIETFRVNIGNNESLKIVCWDLGGQPQFRFFLEDFIGGTNVVLFVFDLNRYSSLNNLEKEWIPLFQREVPTLDRAYCIGNKLDLGQAIDDEEIQRVADKYMLPLMKISAIEGTNLDELLTELQKLGAELKDKQE
jgi:small GTP-binding protein